MKNKLTIALPSWIVVLFVVLLQAPAVAQSETDDELERIAMDYLATLERMDWERQKTFYTAASVFEDPTSAIFGEPWHFVGPEAIAGFWRDSAEKAGTLSIENTYRKVFVAGGLVVVELDAKVRNRATRLGFPDDEFECTFHVVSILRIQDGKIVHHLDHADYASAVREMAAVKAELAARP